ncbi:LysE family transporter [Cnuibacter physcomitrellae]|uniref:LysE family transporter n=1 Tax=Cnuibacter physcomitrellae TaxID=1619308 RepID=UPI002175A3D2|nr:LysE family transporter [Cnuibacter physcomitrellae]MCS5497555.1 LysE family transporter [Cnuibacter physcomitrellae]
MDPLEALGAGIIAGFALALPLGAIGVLLLQEGASRGLARGAPAAVAVAAVDVLYCAAAVSVGAHAAPLIASWSPWPGVIGGVALLAIATRGFVRAARPGAIDVGADMRRPRSRHRFLLFFGLTALNPATLLYFTALVAGQGAAPSPAGGVLFVAGVGLASATWQLVLVLTGALVGRRAGPRLARVTTLAGNAAVATLGVVMLAGAWFASGS